MRTSIFCAALFLAACSPGVERQSVELDAGGWSESVRWVYINRDTLSVKELAFVFDYADPSRLTNDRFVVEVDFPRGGRFESAVSPITDTLEMRRVVFSPRAPFEQSGRYVFTLTPLGRTVGVKGVTLELKDGER